jgi:D-alanyl-D-alanine carboxypeptidase
MTAFLALRSAALDEVVVIEREDTLVEGTRVYFKEGDKLTVGELLIGVLLQSGNDAALALARYCGGRDGVQGFVDGMNDMASVLGMTSSRFANPHGLNSDENYSTARDMALLTAAAMDMPEFAYIVAQKTGKVGDITVKNHNKMLWSYPGANGVKTGYTKLAGLCQVSSAERDGQLLIVVTLDDPDDWADHTNMLDYGFAEYPERRLCTEDAFVCELPVVAGVVKRVDIRVRDTVTRSLSESEKTLVRSHIELPRFLWAEVAGGETVGLLRFTINGESVGESELYAAAAVEEIEVKRKSLWSVFKKLLRQGD